ncbi:MAG: glycosyltransferase family 4 protein [Chloroflexi bacterium]|nr:glycosyltransferase family 4 protein [Chloroflexota bacterium]
MLLYISRKHPPSIGGMQRFSGELVAHLERLVGLRVISWGRSQAFLPLFALYALIVASFRLATGRPRARVVHLGDVVLSPIGLLLGLFFRVPVAANAHGLDVIFPNWAYQTLVVACLRKLDLIICNSEATRRECLKRGVGPDRCTVIPMGVGAVDSGVSKEEARRIIADYAGIRLIDRKVVVSVGRLVRRKGISYFVDRALPEIVRRNPDVVYLVVGRGPEREETQRLIGVRSLMGHAALLGEVSDEVLAAIYAAADLFVMPNVPVPGDLEGFGIVALEASAAGLCVVATRLDGIVDAVIDGKNGFLIDPGDTIGLIDTVSALLADEDRRVRHGTLAREFTLAHFAWPDIAARYVTELQKLWT